MGVKFACYNIATMKGAETHKPQKGNKMSDEKALMERFCKENIAVRVGNGENLDKFLEMCARQGIRWRSGSIANEWKPSGEAYGENLCISCGYIGEENCISYSDKQRIKKDGRTVVDFDDFIKGEKTDTQKIIITSDGKTTHARLVDGKKTVKVATAICSDSDTFDFLTEAGIAFKRLTAEEKKLEPEKPALKIKVGDKVKIRSWESMEKEFGLDTDGDIGAPTCFVQGMRKFCGQTVTVKEIGLAEGDFFIEEDNRGYYFVEEFVESIVTDEHSEPDQKKHKYKVGDRVVWNGHKGTVICISRIPIKPYGVEFDEQGIGKHNCDCYILESGSHGTKANSLWKDESELSPAAQDEPAVHSVKEVHRQAKVGEYVRILTGGGYATGTYTVGKVYKVEKKSGNCVKLRTDDGENLYNWLPLEYVVLEGYNPENADDEKNDEKPETFRDRLKREHPEYVDDMYGGGCKGCPHDYGYEDKARKGECLAMTCTQCWSRLIPAEKSKEPEKPKYLNGKVVCVKTGCPWWTVGKVYDVVDGIITANDGDTYPSCKYEPYKDYEDIRHAGCLIGDQRHNIKNEFIEFKG